MFKRLASFCSQLKGTPKKMQSLTIEVPDNPFLVLLAQTLDWGCLIGLAAARRLEVLKMPHVGCPPHLREMLGVLIYRALENCTLQAAMEHIRYYAPARILCGLIDAEGKDSGFTPNFRTISDFEILMGAEILAQINALVLRAAVALGFANPKGLAADTTAQEAAIPYPTEVGLMSSFQRSLLAGIRTLGQWVRGSAQKAFKEICKEIQSSVRKYRLFAKTQEIKDKISQTLLEQSKKLQSIVIGIYSHLKANQEKLKGKYRRVFNRLPGLLQVFTALIPQIKYYLKNHKPCTQKILSLFMPEARSIPRGKEGKQCEFGFKWLVNRVRGGYIAVFANPNWGNISDVDCAFKAVQEHIALFGKPPKDFSYDRGGWSEAQVKRIKELGVKNVAIAPKGKAEWAVSVSCKKELRRERAQVEGNIGCLKRAGFNFPYAKNTEGTLRAGHRTALAFNLKKLVRDVKAVNYVQQLA